MQTMRVMRLAWWTLVGRKHVHVLAAMVIATVQLSSLAPALGEEQIRAGRPEHPR